VVTVNATSGLLSNTATVSGNESDPSAANNSATEDTTVTPSTDLAISKTRTPATVVPGGNVTYSVFVTNNGPSDATGVVVTDTLPSGVTLVGTSITCAGTTTLVCDLGNITSGNNTSFTIVVSVDAATPPGTLLNTATVAGNEFDPNTGNNTGTAPVTVTTDTDLSITKTASSDPAIIGTVLTYTLTIANAGPANATGVLVTDTLPTSGVDQITAPDADCNENLGIVTCNIGNLAAGSSTQRIIGMRVNASAGISITNQAEISGDQPDPNTSNNTTVITTTVSDPGADIEVSKTVDNPAPVEGATIVYTIVITNNGTQNGSQAEVDDMLPAGVTYVIDNGGGDYDDASGVWDVGNLSVGSSATLLITATVDAGTSGFTIDNTATGSATQSDPVPGNNSDTASITVP
jgi:uncharacterized repeat protein (TIGR01451 family)